MTCSKCGNQLANPAAKFCNKCGSAQVQTPKAAILQPAQQHAPSPKLAQAAPPVPVTEAQPSKRKLQWRNPVIATVVCVVCLGQSGGPHIDLAKYQMLSYTGIITLVWMMGLFLRPLSRLVVKPTADVASWKQYKWPIGLAVVGLMTGGLVSDPSFIAGVEKSGSTMIDGNGIPTVLSYLIAAIIGVGIGLFQKKTDEAGNTIKA